MVRNVRRRPLGEGVGMVSGLEMLELEYERGDGPATMVFKFPGTNDANRAVALAFDLYRREVLFYRDVAAFDYGRDPRGVLRRHRGFRELRPPARGPFALPPR